MAQVLGRSFIDGSLIGVAVWFLTQLGLFFAFLTAELFGQLLFLPFYLLATWPNIILSLFRGQEASESYYENRYGVQVLVSLVGWLLLSIIVSVGWNLYQRKRRSK